MYRIIIFCVLISAPQFLLPTYLYSQPKIEPELLTLFQQTDPVERNYNTPLEDSSSEFDIILSTGFFIYKKVFSSQDKPSCVFTPSCSEFAVEAFRKKGVVVGWLQTFDRLSRCHGLVNHSHYHFDIEKNRFYDPVQ